jgi:hypothetical protein
MLRLSSIILLLLFVNVHVVLSQDSADSSLSVVNYPLIIGNVGFATDSVDVVVGDVPRAEVSNFSFGIYNFGKNAVTFTNGKSNKFISVNFIPVVLMPSSVGTMNVEFNADNELNMGEFVVEVSVVSNDDKNPYKFINLIMNIVAGSNEVANSHKFDTVPAILFDHYNYDFGHFVRGRRDDHTYLVSNVGGIPLVIDKIVVPKGIKIIDSPTQPLYPGEKSAITLRINTHGRVGLLHQSVLVYSNDPNNPLIILGVHGSVRILPSNKKAENQCGELIFKGL